MWNRAFVRGGDESERNSDGHSPAVRFRARLVASSLEVHARANGFGFGGAVRRNEGRDRGWRRRECRGREGWPLGLLDLDPGFANCQQIRDLLGDPALGRMELDLNQVLTQSVIKLFKIPGYLASVGKVQRRLQVPDD